MTAMEPLDVFVHLPRTAGTTVKHVLARNYPAEGVIDLGPNVQEAICRVRSLDARERDRVRLIHGHVAYGVHDVFGQPARYFTLLRDPVERVVSFHRYVQRSPWHYLHEWSQMDGRSLHDYVTSGVTIAVDNLMVRLISGVWDQVGFGELDRTHLERATDHLARFAAVGLQERFTESLLWFAQVLGWRDVYHVPLNSTEPTPLDPDDRTAIEGRNELDRELYETARRRLEHDLSEAGARFAAQRRIFEVANALRAHRTYADAAARGLSPADLQSPVYRTRRRLLAGGRSALKVVARHPRGGRILARARIEIERAGELAAADQDGRSPSADQHSAVGRDYERSNANCAAFLVWRHFPGRRTLDVGCARGFVVEALRELGFDTQGVDVSYGAIDQATPGARGHVRRADLLERLPWPDAAMDVVMCLENLELLPPERIPGALTELRRVCNGWLICTIPSFGPNEHGPSGWLEGRTRHERLPYYRGLGPTYEGPIPYEDLYRDGGGQPLQGHLTVASFTWWTRKFTEAGFVRRGEVERRIHPELTALGLSRSWTLYVLSTDHTPVPEGPVRSQDQTRALIERWGLAKRHPEDGDLDRLREALGPQAVEEANRFLTTP